MDVILWPQKHCSSDYKYVAFIWIVYHLHQSAHWKHFCFLWAVSSGCPEEFSYRYNTFTSFAWTQAREREKQSQADEADGSSKHRTGGRYCYSSEPPLRLDSGVIPWILNSTCPFPALWCIYRNTHWLSWKTQPAFVFTSIRVSLSSVSLEFIAVVINCV